MEYIFNNNFPALKVSKMNANEPSEHKLNTMYIKYEYFLFFKELHFIHTKFTHLI
jgi:hypothetical protein